MISWISNKYLEETTKKNLIYPRNFSWLFFWFKLQPDKTRRIEPDGMSQKRLKDSKRKFSMKDYSGLMVNRSQFTLWESFRKYIFTPLYSACTYRGCASAVMS